nr:hypothetical protein [Tanacetum cinerariifolium]
MYVVPFHTRKIFTTLRVNSPSFSGMIVPLFDSMLVPQGEGSGTPTESHHTPTYEASQSSQHELPSPLLPPVPTDSLPTDIPSDNPPLKQYTRRTRIAHSSVLSPVADEPASLIGDDSQGEACLTDSGFAADQDKANIAKTSTLPSDSTPRVTSLAADEGSMQQKLNELTALCTSLQRQQSEMVSKSEAQELEINSLKARIKLLEDKDRWVAKQSGDDAPIKGRRLDEGEESAERASDDTEEMATVLTSMDAASILTSGGVQVVPTAAEVATATISIPTGSGVVSTVGPTILTAAPTFTTATESTPYTKRKGKEKKVESDTPKKKKLQEQIDVQVARELEDQMTREDQRMSESNETVVKYLQDYEQILEDLSIGERIELISDLVKYRENYAQVLKYQTLQRNPRSKKQKKDYYMAEEAERLKRKGLRLEQESAKKLKTSEEVPEELKSSEEVPEEKVKEMMQLVPVEEVFVEALQVKHPIIDWKLDREDLNQLWRLVKESLSIRPATSDKEIEIWVELKRLYEPDVEDQLWTHTQNLMHAPVKWKFDEFPLPEQLPIANEDKFPLLIQSDATVKKIALLVKSRNNDIENYLKNKKLEQVVAIIKSCTPNVLGDLTVNLKDLSGTIPGTYITKSLIKGWCRWSGILMEEEEIVKLREKEEMVDLELQVCGNVTDQDEKALNLALEEEAREARAEQEWLEKCRQEEYQMEMQSKEHLHLQSNGNAQWFLRDQCAGLRMTNSANQRLIAESIGRAKGCCEVFGSHKRNRCKGFCEALAFGMAGTHVGIVEGGGAVGSSGALKPSIHPVIAIFLPLEAKVEAACALKVEVVGALDVVGVSLTSLSQHQHFLNAVSYKLMRFGLTIDAAHLMLLVDDLSSHNTKYTSPALTQKVFANMRRIGKGFLGVDTPLFNGMLVQQQVHAVEDATEDEDDDNEVFADPTPPSLTPVTPPPSL